MIELILIILLITVPGIAVVVTYRIVWRRIRKQIERPMIAIHGYAEMLLTEHWGELTIKQKQRLEIIKSYSTSLLLLIQKTQTKLIQ